MDLESWKTFPVSSLFAQGRRGGCVPSALFRAFNQMMIYFAPCPTTEALETSHVMSTLKKQLDNHVIVLFGRVFGAAEVATPALCHRLDIAPILRYFEIPFSAH